MNSAHEALLSSKEIEDQLVAKFTELDIDRLIAHDENQRKLLRRAGLYEEALAYHSEALLDRLQDAATASNLALLDYNAALQRLPLDSRASADLDSVVNAAHGNLPPNAAAAAEGLYGHLHPSLHSRAFGSLAADEREFLERSSVNQFGGSNSKVYSAIPPPGYICKLCYVEGHWLKNCSMYRERKRDHSSHNFGHSSHIYHLMAAASANESSLKGGHGHGHGYHNGGHGHSHNGHHHRQSSNGGGRNPSKTSVPPDGYVCRKCNTPGHWIQQCSLKSNVPPDTYTCKICNVKGHW
ncbi:hypothetical protein HK102_003906 [Quaeritorhiza haematococci]|nr:hypothetical protein HK102_003906 [Quaeritorhiza haematococci]